MKALIILLMLASVALNACFFTGCRTLHDAVYGNPCKFKEQVHVSSGKDGNKAELIRIADLLGIKTSDKSSSDLVSDICYKLDRSDNVPTAYDTQLFEKMTKALGEEQEKAMREYQRFISDLQGKRVIVIDPEN